MTQTKTQQFSPEIFTIWSDEIERRIDPSFYRPQFKELEKIFTKGKYKIKTLKDIAEKIASGATPLSGGNAYTSKQDGIPFIRSGDIRADKTIAFDDLLYIKKEIHQIKLKSSHLKKGDVLIAIVGATIGQVSLYDYEKEANINQAIALVRVKKDINSEYVKEYLLSNIGQNQLNKIKRPVARANINLDEVGSIKIPIPSIAIQNEIVAIMQKAYEEKRQKEAEARKLLDSIDDYVLGELRIKMPEIKKEMVFEVWSNKVDNNRIDTEYWQPKYEILARELNKIKTYRLGEIISDLSGGATPKVTEEHYLENGGLPFLRVQNITKAGIDLNDVKYIKREVHDGELKRSQLKKDDIVFTITGRIGSAAIVPDNFEGNINQHSVRFHLIDRVDNIKILPEFIAFYLNTNFANMLNLREVTGGTRPALDYQAVKNIKILIPPLPIQNKIVEKIKSYYSQVRTLQSEARENLQKAKEKVEKMILE